MGLSLCGTGGYTTLYYVEEFFVTEDCLSSVLGNNKQTGTWGSGSHYPSPWFGGLPEIIVWPLALWVVVHHHFIFMPPDFFWAWYTSTNTFYHLCLVDLMHPQLGLPDPDPTNGWVWQTLSNPIWVLLHTWCQISEDIDHALTAMRTSLLVVVIGQHGNMLILLILATHVLSVKWNNC